MGGSPHPHSFSRGLGRRTCCFRQTGGGRRRLWRRLEGLEVIKTTRSGFVGFFRDEYTTLPETADRIFATEIDAEWEYHPERPGTPDYSAVFDVGEMRVILETFARHESASVQQTIYAMGEACLRGCPQISTVSFTLPNQHRLLVDLAPFGMDESERDLRGHERALRADQGNGDTE